ncbi:MULTISPECIES: hypothetical protein [unclassified Streptomyces]|uniref:hypothetical protein n=1 Tax=unclassified Streptomyces TaxID=2593676 RepID=UPI00093B928C|nr:hypothetical protein [Streptomyces sp. TSRI0107]OKJ87898.1 hypothetical protein AMK31_12245 [Streptomyces sp. TSRI0107]
MASSSAGLVTGLTAAAIGTVGFLAFQAAANVPPVLGKHARGTLPAAAASKAPRDELNPAALPAGSGRGKRVVYSLDDDRVWLVGADNKVRRTFEVTPSELDPVPGVYEVTSRSNRTTGSDGTPIEHVVRFASVDHVTIGFSAAVDGSTPPPEPGTLTGGIRQSRADGNAMWNFATIGQQVVVIR